MEKLWRIWLTMMQMILLDVEGDVDNRLHGVVVIRKRSRKTNTYRVWRRMKALETMEFLN
jgi:hypothetical protein